MKKIFKMMIDPVHPRMGFQCLAKNLRIYTTQTHRPGPRPKLVDVGKDILGMYAQFQQASSSI
jgi:hypothetical protein